MTRKKLAIAILAGGFAVALGWLALRKEHVRTSSGRGQELARAYCQACHLFPEPALLDKASWTNGALPEMARWLGLAAPQIERLPSGEIVADSNVFPPTPLVTQ